ncbi:MAG: type II secretion system F family protein [Planctomycetaceae bacterium]
MQDAGLPILRSLRILEGQSRPGPLKNALIDVIEEIESGSTLSEAMAKQLKAFDNLYVNMVKAGEAGGALEIILQRLRTSRKSPDPETKSDRGDGLSYRGYGRRGHYRDWYYVLHHSFVQRNVRGV